LLNDMLNIMSTKKSNTFLNVEIRNGAGIVWMDNPDEKVNTLNQKLIDELPAVLDDLLKNDDVKGVILISSKKDTFIAGADIKLLRQMKTRDEVTRFNLVGNDLLDRLENFPKPTIAAIHGAALGGGLEVAMACSYRLATDHSKTKFGLPEVKLGLLPGGGGTQRLPRLVGLQQALDMMLTGKNIYPYPAKKRGLIDELIHKDALLDAAITTVHKLSENSHEHVDKRSFLDQAIEGSLITRGIVYRKAKEQVMKSTQGNYPAPLKILHCVKVGLEKGFKAGREAETAGFTELVFSKEAKQLINLFLAMQEVKKNPWDKKAKDVREIGVLGAGLMGAGIAQVSADNGKYDVVLKDMNIENAGKGVKMIYDDVHKKVKKRIISSFEEDLVMSRLLPTDSYGPMKGCDLVIEAVFEDLDIKQSVLKETENATSKDVIFASNTSSLPITKIAEKARKPDQVVGMHYFSPVPKMPLLEIIKTDKTADWVLGTAYNVGLKQGKTNIVVNDGPGFYTTRILAPFMNEALLLLEEGARIKDIDHAMKKWGFPVGPVNLMDEVGLDVAAHVTEVMSDLFKSRGMEPSDKADKIQEAGYMGKKNKKGFYRYKEVNGRTKKDVPNAEIYEFFGGSERTDMEFEEIQTRMSLMMINEAAFCLGEGILESARDGDLGAILGLGFPPFLGGPFRYMDSIGVKTIANQLQELAKSHGPRFNPAPKLTEMAKKGKTFYKD